MASSVQNSNLTTPEQARLLYRAAMGTTVGGVAIFWMGWVPALPLWAYFFLAALLWAIGMGVEIFRSEGEMETPPALPSTRGPEPERLLPRSEMEVLLDRLVQEQSAAARQMNQDAQVWPVLRERPRSSNEEPKPIEFSYEDVEKLPSLLRAAIRSHAGSVPALPADDPFLRGGRDRYRVIPT